MEAPTLGGFRALALKGNVIPVWREVPADCLTPVMAWLLAASRRRQSFLLESAEGGERFGRYSFVGWDPHRTLRAWGTRVEIGGGRRRETREGPWIDAMRATMGGMTPAIVPGLPRFTGGAVGFIGYDAGRRIETAPADPGNGSGELPDVSFGFYDDVLAFDHLRQCLLLIVSVRTEVEGHALKVQFERAGRRLDRLMAPLARPLPGRRRSVARPPGGKAKGRRNRPRSNLTRAGYLERVEKIREYIRAGEAYQVVLSQRFRLRMGGDPFEVYRALRRINPSPYMYFLRDGDQAIAGASPEMLVRVEQGRVEPHPSAGTRPRGAGPEEDRLNEEALLADPKERAEHVMLVDLGRNDLGRVCRPGSIRVKEMMTVERFSHVMHLVTRIEGALAPGRDAFDALAAAFPAGTVSGAPKVRAMEIIRELEPTPRGPYAGVICYVDHAGNLDSCITIRTMVASGDTAWVQAGGGVVADSEPHLEYEESVSKARAVIAAINEAGS